jgi:hypothetical protein
VTRRLFMLLALTLAIGAGVAYAASLTVTSWHLWAGSQTLTKPAPCTLSGTAVATDTYADESVVADNSAGTTMKVKPGAGSRQWVFIRFNLATCAIPTTGGADTATLKLRISTAPASSRTLTVTPVLATWTGASLANFTAATALSYGATTTTFTTGTTSGVFVTFPVTIDIDALIKNSTANFGWRIMDGGGGTTTTTTFNATNSGTAANRPQLVINYAS